MKNISLFTCSILVSLVVLSACAQTSVSVRATEPDTKVSLPEKPIASQRQYAPISRNEPYTVQAGDTLYGISFRAGLSYREVAVWNDIPEPYALKIGQRIALRPAVITPAMTTEVAGAPKTPDPRKPLDVPNEVKPVLADTPAAVVTTPAPVETIMPTTTSVILVPQPVQPPIVAAPEKPVVAPEIRNTGNIQWRWPSDGALLARYVQGEPTQQGINIGGKSGQAVRAAGDGTVVYSGAGLVGYGELIIIKHNNEWLSAYAHNRRRLVAEGTRVKSGDVIAEMGRTGTMRDMLHFEIRRNGKPVDPLLYLPKQ